MNKIKKFNYCLLGLLLGFILTLNTSNLRAQGGGPLNTDRPGQAINPAPIGKGTFQIQTGFTLSGFNNDFPGGFDVDGNGFQYTLNPRFGITNRLELNSTLAFRSDNIEIGNDENELSGLSLVNFGTRFTVVEGGGLAPTIALQFDLSLNTVSDDYEMEDASPRLLLAHSQNILDWLTLTTNFGIQWDGNSDNTIGIYIVNFSFPIGDNIGYFVEAYANSSDGDFDINFDTGLGYLVNDNLQLDISGGYGSNDNLNDWFIDAGLTWRLPTQ